MRVCVWGGGGGGGDINFCHPEVVKLQQQCHMHNTNFDLPQEPADSIHFFIWERENANILETATGKNENENPVRKWDIMFFNHYINVWFKYEFLGKMFKVFSWY